VSKHKRRTGSDIQNQTRPTPADRIFAQRAQYAEASASNQEEDRHQCQQQLHPGSFQEPPEAEADNQDVVHHQDRRPLPVQPVEI